MAQQRTRFVIRNDFPTPVVLNLEPEGTFFPLGEGDEVSVTDTFTTTAVTVKLSRSVAGDPVVSLWPGDGDVRVEKDGVDILDLVQKETTVQR